MRQYIRCYNMFLPGKTWWMKLFIYLVYPLLAIWVIQIVDTEAFACFFEATVPLLATEVAVDFYTVSPFVYKNAKVHEYLKSLTRWPDCIKKALVMDGIRRFGCLAVAEFGTFFLLGIRPGGWEYAGVGFEQAMFFLVAAFALEELTLLGTRRCSSEWIIVMLCMCCVFSWIFWGSLLRWGLFMVKMHWIIIILLLFVGIGLVRLQIRQVVRDIERRGFYEGLEE